MSEPTKALELPRDRLWGLIKEKSAKLTGVTVSRLLDEASQTAWDAGIDRLYDNSSDLPADIRSGSFDLMWMSIFLAALTHAVQNPCCCGGGCDLCT